MSWIIAAHRCEVATPGDYVLLPWAADGELAVVPAGTKPAAAPKRELAKPDQPKFL